MAIYIHLIGGEVDGYRSEVPSADQPELIYAYWPGFTEKIAAVRDPIARGKLKRSLETLGYRYQRIDIDDEDSVVCYRRDVSADKPLPVDADL